MRVPGTVWCWVSFGQFVGHDGRDPGDSIWGLAAGRASIAAQAASIGACGSQVCAALVNSASACA